MRLSADIFRTEKRHFGTCVLKEMSGATRTQKLRLKVLQAGPRAPGAPASPAPVPTARGLAGRPAERTPALKSHQFLCLAGFAPFSLPLPLPLGKATKGRRVSPSAVRSGRGLVEGARPGSEGPGSRLASDGRFPAKGTAAPPHAGSPRERTPTARSRAGRKRASPGGPASARPARAPSREPRPPRRDPGRGLGRGPRAPQRGTKLCGPAGATHRGRSRAPAPGTGVPPACRRHLRESGR